MSASLSEAGTRLSIRMPFDMHHHVRGGETLAIVGGLLAPRFAGAIIMPNTQPPITTAAMVEAYRADVIAATAPDFQPLMTLYLTDTLDPEQVRLAREQHGLAGIKYYPRGLTTNSDSGVANPAALWTPGTTPFEVLRTLAELDAVLLLHAADGFAADGSELDPYDQETHFIRETLPRIIQAHPGLKISVEHLSTKEGAAFVRANQSAHLGCSLTAQHLLLDRRDVHRGGFRPHMSWWPIIQREDDKLALRELAASGSPYVWLGSDSAPHPIGKKETDCCAGGVMMVHAGVELYAEAFDVMGALDRFEAFASLNGPRFYGLAPSDRTIELVREDWVVRNTFHITSDEPRMDEIRPFRLGEKVAWKLAA